MHHFWLTRLCCHCFFYAYKPPHPPQSLTACQVSWRPQHSACCQRHSSSSWRDLLPSQALALLPSAHLSRRTAFLKNVQPWMWALFSHRCFLSAVPLGSAPLGLRPGSSFSSPEFCFVTSVSLLFHSLPCFLFLRIWVSASFSHF